MRFVGVAFEHACSTYRTFPIYATQTRSKSSSSKYNGISTQKHRPPCERSVLYLYVYFSNAELCLTVRYCARPLILDAALVISPTVFSAVTIASVQAVFSVAVPICSPS